MPPSERLLSPTHRFCLRGEDDRSEFIFIFYRQLSIIPVEKYLSSSPLKLVLSRLYVLRAVYEICPLDFQPSPQAINDIVNSGKPAKLRREPRAPPAAAARPAAGEERRSGRLVGRATPSYADQV